MIVNLSRVIDLDLSAVRSFFLPAECNLDDPVEWRFCKTENLSPEELRQMTDLRNKEIVSLEDLPKKVVDDRGRIFDSIYYMQLTEDKSDCGILQFLNGELNPDIRNIDLLAWTGLKNIIKSKISFIEMHLPAKRDQLLKQFTLENGVVFQIENKDIEGYAWRIIDSYVSKDQYIYLMGNGDGYTQNPVDNKLSKEKFGVYFLSKLKANNFKRKSKFTEENLTAKSNGITKSIASDKYSSKYTNTSKRW